MLYLILLLCASSSFSLQGSLEDLYLQLNSLASQMNTTVAPKKTLAPLDDSGKRQLKALCSMERDSFRPRLRDLRGDFAEIELRKIIRGTKNRCGMLLYSSEQSLSSDVIAAINELKDVANGLESTADLWLGKDTWPVEEKLRDAFDQFCSKIEANGITYE